MSSRTKLVSNYFNKFYTIRFLILNNLGWRAEELYVRYIPVIAGSSLYFRNGEELNARGLIEGMEDSNGNESNKTRNGQTFLPLNCTF